MCHHWQEVLITYLFQVINVARNVEMPMAVIWPADNPESETKWQNKHSQNCLIQHDPTNRDLENKRWDFLFCPSSMVYAGIHHSKYWMLIHYDTIEDGQNKKILSFILILVTIVLFLHFIGGIYLSQILLHHFIGFIWIFTPLMKINVSIQETKIIMWHSSHA